MSTNGNGHIPFLDLASLHQELEPELLPVFQKAIRSAGFVGGPMVEEFEKDFAAFCGTKYSVGVANGTDAVRFALMAAGVQTGDIVVTVPYTFIATTEAITQSGARPDFVDIDERTYSMDPAKLQEYLEKDCYLDQETGRPFSRKLHAPVTAVVPVHLYGQMADMDAILELARRYKLVVIEDACQAHGAEYFSKEQNCWKKAGSMGRAAAFSFYPGKNLGACGEAGAITTNDEELARKVKMLREHGQSKKYYHDMEGYNGRLDSLQAGFLTVKLRHLPKWNKRRREVATRYNEALSSVEGLVIPYQPDWARSAYHLYAIRVPDREKLQQHLTEANIGSGTHYPFPLHLQKAYKNFEHKPGDFPVSERVASEILSIPMCPMLTEEQQNRVISEVSNFMQTAMVSVKASGSRDHVGATQRVK